LGYGNIPSLGLWRADKKSSA
jgi:hypothetical protein